MLKTFFKIFKNKKNIIFFFIIYFFVFFIFRITPDFLIYIEFLKLKSFMFSDFFEYFLDRTLFSFASQLFWDSFLNIIIPFLISLNIVLFKELYKKQKNLLKDKSMITSLSGMFFGFFGVGCAACSGILFAPLISALGLTAVFNLLPYKGSELAYLGIFILFLSCLYILKQISSSMICK